MSNNERRGGKGQSHGLALPAQLELARKIREAQNKELEQAHMQLSMNLNSMLMVESYKHSLNQVNHTPGDTFDTDVIAELAVMSVDSLYKKLGIEVTKKNVEPESKLDLD